MRRLLIFTLFGVFAASGTAPASDSGNTVAAKYAHLVLALGQHDPDYVDAFYGSAEWKTRAEKEKKSLDAIGAEATELSATLAKNSDEGTTSDQVGGCGRVEVSQQN